jgi:hypothetical protein
MHEGEETVRVILNLDVDVKLDMLVLRLERTNVVEEDMVSVWVLRMTKLTFIKRPIVCSNVGIDC